MSINFNVIVRTPFETFNLYTVRIFLLFFLFIIVDHKGGSRHEDSNTMEISLSL